MHATLQRYLVQLILKFGAFYGHKGKNGDRQLYLENHWLNL